MKLSIFLATRNGASRNPPGKFSSLLQRLRALADELVVVVDDTSTDDTFAVAEEFTKSVFPFAHDPMFSEMRRQSFSRCTGDWIFWVDDDDWLNRLWTRAVFDRLMSRKSVTHYWIPARHIVSEEGSYLSTAPYIGHVMALLHRNIDSIAVLPMKLHQQMAIAGEPAYLAGLYVEPMDFVWHDRSYREQKLNTYEEAYDEEGTGFDQRRFYLYEDYYFEARRPEESYEPKIMQRIEAGDAAPGLHVKILDSPEKMTAGQTYWLTVRITNNSDRILLPQSEFISWGTLAVTYRWSGGAAPLADAANIHTPFPARIEPQHEHDALIRVKAPDVPGVYLLQPDILEESKRWFSESAYAGVFDAKEFEVVPLVWPPKIGGPETE